MRRLLIVTALTALTTPALADPPPQTPMTFTIQGDAIHAVGKIQINSGNDFERIRASNPAIRVVQFHSTGGSTIGGMYIGRMIAKHGMTTRVTQSCYSACALAFLGGRERETASNGTVAFHQFYNPNGDQMHVANLQAAVALEIQYVLDMGIDAHILVYMFRTPQDQIYFLTMKDRLDLKVITREYNPKTQHPAMLPLRIVQTPGTAGTGRR